MSKTQQHLVKDDSKIVQVNDVLNHPLEQGAKDKERARWRYKFLRVTRYPTPDRPDSGRILVENVATGKRDEFYALLFGAGFKVI
jgi:hypothetical protein